MLKTLSLSKLHRGFEKGQKVPKRGNIRIWSGKSRSRFRKELFSWAGDGAAYGVTCTLPAFPRPRRVAFESRESFKFRLREWEKDSKFVLQQWLPLVERFRVSLARLRISGFWRVELQQNSFPHLHCVLWLPSIRYTWRVVNAWINALHGVTILHGPYGPIPADFADGVTLHSCCIQLARDFSLWRYLCDHASKKKQCQLGFLGRQWGYFGRKFMHPLPSATFDLTDSQFDNVLRCLRRLTKCQASRGRGGKSVWFTDPLTIDKLIAFYKGVKEVPI